MRHNIVLSPVLCLCAISLQSSGSLVLHYASATSFLLASHGLPTARYLLSLFDRMLRYMTPRRMLCSRCSHVRKLPLSLARSLLGQAVAIW